MLPFKALVKYTSSIETEYMNFQAKFTSIDQAKKFARRLKKDGVKTITIYGLDENGNIQKEIKFR